MSAIPITTNDLLFALVGAAIIFVVFKAVSAAARMFISRSSEIHFNPDQFDNILENCYRTFPIDCLSFQGATFRRGASVRVTTIRETIIEGHFIGINRSEMVCFMTDRSVIAQEIGSIREITAL